MSVRDLLPIVAVVGVLALVPFGASANTVLNFLVFTLIITLAAQGWNILGGYGGQFSFGHAAFFGTGAYAMAMLQVHLGLNAWVAFAIGIGAGAMVGFVIGFLSFRSGLRGSYFALVTLAFAEVLRIVANASAITGGAAGLLIQLDVRPVNFQFHSRAAFFWIGLALVALVLVLTRWLEHSRFGAQLMAVRENEDAARALGVDALTVKLGAITLSAAVTAAAGCLYAQYFLYLDADDRLRPLDLGRGAARADRRRNRHRVRPADRRARAARPRQSDKPDGWPHSRHRSRRLRRPARARCRICARRAAGSRQAAARPALPPRRNGDRVMLAVERITKRFGGLVAVNDASLRAGQGRITGLIGPNGAGKTTLFAVIAGFEPPTAGRVLYDGADITSEPVHRRAHRGIARTFQIVQPFAGLTVRENIAVGAYLRHRARKDALQRAEAVARQVGLGGMLDRRPTA